MADTHRSPQDLTGCVFRDTFSKVGYGTRFMMLDPSTTLIFVLLSLLMLKEQSPSGAQKPLILGYVLLVSVYLFIKTSGVWVLSGPMNVFNYARTCVCKFIDVVVDVEKMFRYGMVKIDNDDFWERANRSWTWFRYLITPLGVYYDNVFWTMNLVLPPVFWIARAGFVSIRDLSIMYVELFYLLGRQDSVVTYRATAKGILVFNLDYCRNMYFVYYSSFLKFYFYMILSSILVSSWIPLGYMKVILISFSARLYLHDKITREDRSFFSRCKCWFVYRIYGSSKPRICDEETQLVPYTRLLRIKTTLRRVSLSLYDVVRKWGNIIVIAVPMVPFVVVDCGAAPVEAGEYRISLMNYFPTIPHFYLDVRDFRELSNHGFNVERLHYWQLMDYDEFIFKNNGSNYLEYYIMYLVCRETCRDDGFNKWNLFRDFVFVLPFILIWFIMKFLFKAYYYFCDWYKTEIDNSRVVFHSDELRDEFLKTQGRCSWLAARWNKLMHSLFGNIDNYDDEFEVRDRICNFELSVDEQAMLNLIEKERLANKLAKKNYLLNPELTGYELQTSLDINEAPEVFVILMFEVGTISELIRGLKTFTVSDLNKLSKYFEDNKLFYFMNCSCIYMKKLVDVIINRKNANLFVGTCDNNKRSRDVRRIKGEVIHYEKHKVSKDPLYIVEPEECLHYKLLPSMVVSLSDAQMRLKHKSFLLTKNGTVKIGVNYAGVTIMESVSMHVKMVRSMFYKVSFYSPSNKGYNTDFAPMLLSDFVPISYKKDYVVCGIQMKYLDDMDCIDWARNNGYKSQVYDCILGNVEFSDLLQSQLNSACTNGRLKLDSNLWKLDKKEVKLEEVHFQNGIDESVVEEKYVTFGDMVKHFGGDSVSSSMVSHAVELAALLSFMDLIYNCDSMFRVFEITLLYVRKMEFPMSLIEEINSLSSRGVGVNFQNGGMSSSIWEKLQFTTLLELYRIFSRISWYSLLKMLPDFKLGGYSLKMPMKEMSKTNGFFSSVARVVVHFMEKFKECFKTGSLSPLLDRFSSPSAVYRKISNLSVHSTLLCGYNASARQQRELKELIEQEVIDEDYCSMMTPSIYAEEVAILHKACKELLLKWDNDLAASILLKDGLKTAELLMSKIRMRSLASSGRKQPFGLVLYGDVGVGKSELRNLVHATACNVLGVPSEGTVAIWTVTNFQDTYNDMCITVMMDDIDHSMSYTEFNHAKAIKECIGVEPQYVESARVEDKGNTFASHQLVIYITNFKELNLTAFTMMKSAVFRRLPFYAHVKLNPEVSTGPLMPGFMSDRGMNIHYIDVYRYNHTVGNDFPYKKVFQNLDTKAFLRLFRKEFETYSKIVPLDDCVKCVCGVHVSVCCCDPWETEEPSVNFQNGFYVDLTVLSHPLVLLFVNTVLLVFVLECYLKLLRGKMLYYIKEIRNFVGRLYLLVYYLWGSTSKLVKFSKLVCEEHLKKYMTVRNAALFACVTAGLIYWNNKTAKYHEQMGMTISTDGTFRRVAMEPQVSAFMNTPATWTKDELINIARLRIVKLVHRDGDRLFVHGLRYGVDLLLIPGHIVTKLIDDDSILEVWAGTQKTFFKKSCIRMEKVDDTIDLCVMHVPQLAMGTTIDKHIYHSFPTNISKFDESLFVCADNVFPVATRMSALDHKMVLLSDGVISNDGDCGLPLISADKKAWRIVGMHFGNDTLKGFSAPTCFADKLERFRIDAAVKKLGVSRIELIPISMQSGNLPIGPTPLTSSVGAYLGTGATNIMYIGTLQGMRKNTFKSNMVLSPLYQYFKDLIVQECGDPLPFVIPATKGGLDEEGYWHDAFTERMRDPMPESFPDDDLLWLSVADYLSGTDELCKQFSVPARLTVLEALQGNDEIFVTPTNMSTSAGPPFNRPKNQVIIPFRVGLEPPLYYDFIPQAAELHTKFVESLTQDSAPWLFSSVFVKDEPVKKKKQFLPRLINNLPFSYNLLMKCLMVGVRNLLRRFPVYYECMVGINIGSSQVVRITGNLLDKGGKENSYEFDYEWFDLTQRGQTNFHVANAYYGMAFATSGPEIAKLLHNLVTAGFKVVFCFNSDLISFGCRNPSGGDQTVETNSKTNSIALRYAYFRSLKIKKDNKFNEWLKDYKLNFFSRPIVSLPEGIVPFRSVVAVSTYGDDGIAASLLNIGEWLNRYVAELGMKITDGRDKSPLVKKRRLEECTFLKRQFTYDSEFEYMLMPLKKEAILRMTMYLLPSALTQIDHMATICNDVLKEASLHGEEFYNIISIIVVKASICEKFHDSAYLKIKTFRERRLELLAGDFVSWSRGMEAGVPTVE